MAWDVETTELFDSWLAEQDENAQDKILASLLVLSELGPNLGAPHVDTIKESKYPNMKEIRVQVKGHPIRGFFTFDPERKAIVLCAGDKKGLNEKAFYKEMIKIADEQYEQYLRDNYGDK
jgi:hypothetical protein